MGLCTIKAIDLQRIALQPCYFFFATSRVDCRSLVRWVIFSADSPVVAARDLISCATTAKPLENISRAGDDLATDLAEMVHHFAVLHFQRLAVADRDDTTFQELQFA